MGISFNWFKSYKINKEEYGKGLFVIYSVEYIDGGSTSHSARNVIDVNNLLEKYGGERIPSIYNEMIQSESDDLGLIPPAKMSRMCEAVLSNAGYGISRPLWERVEQFKRLSDAGYYLAYGE